MAGPASRLHTSALASRSLAFSPTRHVASPGHPGFNSFAHRSIGRQANSASFSPAKKDQSLRKSLQIVAARTESADLPLGDTVPDFELLEPLTGELRHLQHTSGSKGTLIVFMCNHCPFVIHLRDALVQLAKDIKPHGIETIGISSNSVITHPQDGPDKMAEDAHNFGYPFTYLYDESQEVARAYKAACTPEFYLADGNLKLFYHGQFDKSRPSNDVFVTGDDVRNAVDSLLKGEALLQPVHPSMGCGIKWHPAKQVA
ncbi:hypothetical protein WJX79_005181 [Trebouxia sp. C0005]